MNSKKNLVVLPAASPTTVAAGARPGAFLIDGAASRTRLRPLAADKTALVAHREVVRYVRATLRRHGVASQDLADGVAEAQVAAIEAARAGRMPTDIGQWKALSARIAVCWAVDRRRETEARERSDAGPCDDPGAYPGPTREGIERDPVDAKRYLAVLQELFASGQMPRDAAEIVWAQAEHVPHAQVAAELGISVTAVDKQLARARSKFRARLAALGMLPLRRVHGNSSPPEGEDRDLSD
ncbi:MAG TPA: sigma factor-like helix-turn-helix DNA-binding protein [Polyangiaceae bacterium]|nr:sigma factor-like helix-turn-helix DNA-binding protein [Polyangiaceae bacterium]